MSFRARLTLVAAIAVAIAIVLASAIVYVAVRSELRSQVDEGLRARAALISRIPLSVVESRPGQFFLRIPAPALGEAGGYVQLASADGATLKPPEGDVSLPVDQRVREVAAGSQDAFFSDAEVAGTHVRVFAAPLGDGYALQLARPLTEVDDALARIRAILILVAAGGVALAAALGLAVARAALGPVRRLTEATEHVTETRDLARRIDDDGRGRDELSRLAASFNAMLAALEEAARAQRQLVADASHELRTPLTSLRTNIEVLARDQSMSTEERERLLADVVEQLAEMTELVAELVELAHGDRSLGDPEEIRLDLLVAEAVERARRNAPQVEFALDADESTVHGVRVSIERAVANLLDNAAKWSPAGGTVAVRVADGEVIVRDQGPGIDDDDLPYVFDRFYRASTARGMPGSGLGLAIVRQVAEAHDGAVAAERAEGGGTRVRLRLGATEATAAVAQRTAAAES
ncbi:MAG TPA: HAMP domain-containing sensor histidine kinase [Gaiellaceae bacterium]|nr:HAMP domain-containing sensor histidine kinase [Gaiellaceae bacterium]